jgi:hypothetical protein
MGEAGEQQEQEGFGCCQVRCFPPTQFHTHPDVAQALVLQLTSTLLKQPLHLDLDVEQTGLRGLQVLLVLKPSQIEFEFLVVLGLQFLWIGPYVVQVCVPLQARLPTMLEHLVMSPCHD